MCMYVVTAKCVACICLVSSIIVVCVSFLLVASDRRWMSPYSALFRSVEWVVRDRVKLKEQLKTARLTQNYIIDKNS